MDHFWPPEVWLVVAGGAMFAAFPSRYATMCSVFDVALQLSPRAGQTSTNN